MGCDGGPGQREAIFLGIAMGLAMGIGIYTFIYAKGTSYLTDNSAACANCHIMREYYDRWIKSSHRAVAVCNDCHTPAGFLSKYMTKISNGFRHSLAFTTNRFSEPISIKPDNLQIAESSCRRCHQDIVQAIETSQQESARLLCVRCHRSVGHLE